MNLNSNFENFLVANFRQMKLQFPLRSCRFQVKDILSTREALHTTTRPDPFTHRQPLKKKSTCWWKLKQIFAKKIIAEFSTNSDIFSYFKLKLAVDLSKEVLVKNRHHLTIKQKFLFFVEKKVFTVRPSFSPSMSMIIKQGRHPLLDLASDTTVPNDVVRFRYFEKNL